MKLLPVALLALLLTSASGEPLGETFEEFRKEVRLELRSALDKGNAENSERLMRLESLLVERLPAAALDEMNPNAALAVLTQIRVMTKSSKVEELGRKLIDELRVVKERKDKEFATTFAAAMRDGAETMLKATKASELDASLATLMRLQRQAALFSQSDDGRRFQGVDLEQAQALVQLMSQWQDAMLGGGKFNPNRNGGNAEQLESTLASYGQQLHDLVPRSALIERFRALRTNLPAAQKRLTNGEVDLRMREVIREIKTLDDLTPAIAKAEAIYTQLQESGGSSNYYNIGQAQGILRNFRKTYEDLKAGQAVSLIFPTPTSNTSAQAYPGPDDLAAIRGMLLKFAIPRILGLKEDRIPADAESPAVYLQRLSEQARAEKDWLLLGRVLDTAHTLNIAVVATANDANALRLMLAGINQEKAKQLSGAVVSYLFALRSGSQVVPSEWIGEKLEAIRKASPEAFERGEQRSYSQDQGKNVTPRPYLGDQSVLQVPAVPKPATPANPEAGKAPPQ